MQPGAATLRTVVAALAALSCSAQAQTLSTCLSTAVGQPFDSAVIQIGAPFLISASPSSGVIFSTSSGGVVTVVRITQGGVLQLVAGTPGYYDASMLDGALAGLSVVSIAALAASTTSADILFSDGAAIFRIDSAGIMHFVAGSLSGMQGFADGPATSALFMLPYDAGCGLVQLADGSIYVADQGNNVVRLISPRGEVSTFAGSANVPGFSGDNGPASAALLNATAGLALAPNGDLFVADSGAFVVRRISATTHTISTVAGNGATFGISGIGGLAVSAPINVQGSIALSPDGLTLYISDLGCYIRAVSLTTGLLSPFAGVGQCGIAGNGVSASSAQTGINTMIAVDGAGTLWISDYQDNSVRSIAGGLISAFTVNTVAGGPQRPGAQIGNLTSARAQALNYEAGVAVASDNSIFVADTDYSAVYKVSPSGALTVYAGQRFLPGLVGPNGMPATAARLSSPSGLAVSSAGVLFIASTNNHAILAVSAAGIISTYAGDAGGTPGYSGDGLPASSAFLSSPYGLALSSNDDLFVADTGNKVVRKVSSAGIITTVAGSSTSTIRGNGGQATSAMISVSGSIALSPDGLTLYIVDGNAVLRAVTLASGIIASIAGAGFARSSIIIDFDLPASATGTNLTIGSVAVSPSGTVFMFLDQVIVYIDPTTPNLVLVAGDVETNGFVDSADALTGTFGTLAGLMSFGSDGALYFADISNNAVRMLPFSSKPACPAGFSCSCGRNFVACTSPSGFCPANVAAPIAVESGFQTVYSTSPFASDGGLVTSVSQAPCPVGSFCIAGAPIKCLPGSYGAFTMQTSPSGCTPCAVNTFLADAGSGSSAFQLSSPCVACPPRSSAPTLGASQCTWFPVDASSSASLGNSTCPLGQIAFSGPFGGCVPIPEGGVATITGSTSALLTLPPTTYDPDVGDSWALQVRTGLTVGFIMAIPAMIGFIALLLGYFKLIRNDHVLLEKVLWPILRGSDQIGDWTVGAVAHSHPVHWQGTPLGGVCSVLAIAVIFGFGSMLVIAFLGPENVLAAQYVLPSRPEYFELYEGAPFFKLPAALAVAPALSQGLVVQLALQGAACGNFTLAPSFLTEGEFDVSTAASNSHSLFVHTFRCASCIFGALSQLSATFDGSCQSAAVTISAVSARGAVTVASFVAQPPSGSYLSACELAVTPIEDVVIDRSLLANGVSRMPPAPASLAYRSRGLLFSADVSPFTLASSPPPSVQFLVTLVASPTFTGTSFAQRFAYLDLVYQLLATLALGAIFTYLCLFLIERYKKLELIEYMKEEGHVAHTHKPKLSYLMPGVPISDLAKAMETGQPGGEKDAHHASEAVGEGGSASAEGRSSPSRFHLPSARGFPRAFVESEASVELRPKLGEHAFALPSPRGGGLSPSAHGSAATSSAHSAASPSAHVGAASLRGHGGASSPSAHGASGPAPATHHSGAAGAARAEQDAAVTIVSEPSSDVAIMSGLAPLAASLHDFEAPGSVAEL